MKQPTEQEIREFWEWCGLRYDGYGNLYRWRARSLPPIDLNNLFKYAVPKTIERITTSVFKNMSVVKAKETLLKLWLKYWVNGEDPALALFWTIKQVMESEK